MHPICQTLFITQVPVATWICVRSPPSSSCVYARCEVFLPFRTTQTGKFRPRSGTRLPLRRTIDPVDGVIDRRYRGDVGLRSNQEAPCLKSSKNLLCAGMFWIWQSESLSGRHSGKL